MPNHTTEIVFYWLPLVLWMSIIFCLSSIPGPSLPKMPTETINFLAHKTVHFVEYTGLGFLFIRAVIYSKQNLQVLKWMCLSAGIIFLFAASDEWHQSFVPGRYAKWTDVIFDMVYGWLGMFFYLKTRRMASHMGQRL